MFCHLWQNFGKTPVAARGALFLGLTHFCSSVCVQHKMEAVEWQQKWESLGNTYHVNDVRWTPSGHRGEGAHSNNVLDFIIELCIARPDPQMFTQDREYSARRVRNSPSGMCL